MQMVGHETVNVDPEGMSQTLLAQEVEEHANQMLVREQLLAFPSAKGEEVGISPFVERLSQAVGFA